jgi:hypothetical protein
MAAARLTRTGHISGPIAVAAKSFLVHRALSGGVSLPRESGQLEGDPGSIEKFHPPSPGAAALVELPCSRRRRPSPTRALDV